MKQKNFVFLVLLGITVFALFFSTVALSEPFNEFRVELSNGSTERDGQEYFVCNYNEFIATGTTEFDKLVVECQEETIRPHVLFAATKGGANLIFTPVSYFPSSLLLENATTFKELRIKFPNISKEWFFCNFGEYSGEILSGVQKLSVVCEEATIRAGWLDRILLDAVDSNQVFNNQNPVIDTPVIDTPVIDTPVIDTPVIDIPVIDIPVIDIPVIDIPVIDLSECPTPDFQRTRTLEAFIPDINPIYQEQRLVNTQLNRDSGSLETESVYVIPFTTQNRAGITSRFDMAEHPALTSYVKTVTISKCPGEFKRNPDSYVKGAGGACSITVDSINMRFTTSDSEGEDAMSDTYANCVLSKNTQYYINLHPVSGTRFSDAQDGTVFSDDQITCKNKFGKPDPDCRDNGVMFAIRQLGS